METGIQGCDCGFIDAKDPTLSTFNSLLFFDFARATQEDFDHIFIAANYDVAKWQAPYIRAYNTSNMQLSSEGLELTCSVSTDNLTIPSAGVFTEAQTFFYGSYRAQYLIKDETPGTVTGFFYYKNDTSEIDVEYLSAKAPAALQYSVKPQLYLLNGAASRMTLALDPLNKTTDVESEWSFVWTPDAVTFGQNKSRITTNVPQDPGRIMLNHWSDGNPYFSQGPPKQNSSVLVRRIQGVYNDSNVGEMACASTKQACWAEDGVVWEDSKMANGWILDGVYWSRDPLWEDQVVEEDEVVGKL